MIGFLLMAIDLEALKNLGIGPREILQVMHLVGNLLY